MPTESVRIDDRDLEEALQRKPHYLSTTAYLSQIIDFYLNSKVANSAGVGLHLLQDNKNLLEQEFETKQDVQGLRDCDLARPYEEDLRKELTNKKPKKKRYEIDVPPDLDWCKQRILEFWEVKKKNKTENAANFLFAQLNAIKEKYGEQVVLDQLELATAEGFQSITMNKYEKLGLPVANHKQTKEPDPQHGPYKVFKASDIYGDQGPTTNPVMQSLLNGKPL